MTLHAGTTIGRYEIVEPIGQGGMAVVYKARQPALDRVVALKVIRSGFSEDPEFLERFRREARAVARLDHPNVVQVHDFDEIEGRAILAMQLLDGGGLKERVTHLASEQRLMPQDEVVRIVEQMAAGLAYAHARGVIHRDVKPANVMFTSDGRAVVTDFGIARMLGGTQLTATGVGIGTPEYMSPEQGQGGELDARSDVYSLGVVAYELLTGQLPFTGDTPFAVVLKHVRDPLPPPSTRNPALSPRIDEVLMKALAKQPADRYPGVTDLAIALRDVIGTTAGATLPTIVTARPAATPSAPAVPLSVAGGERDRRVAGALVSLALLGVMAFDLSPRLAALDTASIDRAISEALTTASPSPTPRQVAFKPEQLIMPPEELPVSGYEVRTDEAYPDTGREPQWRRIFQPKSTSGQYGPIEFRIGVLEPGRSISPGCDGWNWKPEQPTESGTVASAALGDKSVLCRFRFSDGTRWFVSWVAERNVETITYLFAKISATDAAATDLVLRLSQQQLAIVSRVSPR
ncbi:MAG: protein kinase [Chloroflexi bacterium]|nr:protein kinase [Chloroflexota bacterium]